MRNAKKLLLLLLSLVLLIGVFTIATLADETTEATTATVVYPDGSTVPLNEGDPIVGKEFATEGDAKLFYGVGNTLFKDDATAGWTFTVEGEAEALTELKVTADMLGKKIIAGGVDKVYFTSYEELSGDRKTMVYHLTDDILNYFTDANTGDQGDGIHTGATAYGVALKETYTDSAGKTQTKYWYEGDVLAVKGVVTKLTLTLYNDIEASAMTFCLGYNNDSANKPVYFDLNGHNVTLGATKGGYAGIDGIDLYLYSSKPGAHFICTASVLFTPDDVTNFSLGDDGSGEYVDNIYFHVNRIFATVYGSTHNIIGGHYYQLPGATAPLLPIGRRIATVKNAKFYANNGVAILTDSPWEGAGIAKGSPTIDNCSFYSFGTSDLITATNGATPKFTNCKFYNVNANAPANVSDTSNVLNQTASAKTVTFMNGVTERYFADTLEAAKNFVEGLPEAKKDIAPYVQETASAGYFIENPAPIFEYDAAFNAAQKEAATGVQVYYSYTKDGELFCETDASARGSSLKALLTSLPLTSGSEIKLYSDISMAGSAVNGTGAYRYYLDINGYKLTLTGDYSSFGTLDVNAPYFYIFSSRAGGVIDASAGTAFVHTNDVWINNNTEHIYGRVYVGERVAGGTDYIGNLTVICKTINTDMHGEGESAYYYSTTFVQSENSTAAHMLRMSRLTGGKHIKDVNNCTFVVTNPNTALLHYADTTGQTFNDCKFVYAGDGVVPLFSSAYTAIPTSPVFSGCDFYNVLPAKNMNAKAIDYTNCNFGFSGLAPSDDIDLADATAMYLVRGAAEKTIVANGVSYTLDVALSADRGVLVTFKDDQGVFGTENWPQGAKVTCPANLVRFDAANECIWRNPTCEITTDANGTTATIIWGLKDLWAFTYSNDKGISYVYMSECGETATDVGDMFYNLFAVPNDTYTITLYAEMNLTKPMGFGPLVARADKDYNRDYYNSMVAGAITLDLNGETVTIDASLVGINLAAANFALATPGTQNGYKPAVFGIECEAQRYFTVKSSKAGGQIINNSKASLFGVGEGKSGEVVIDDANNNITIRSNGQIFANVEAASATTMSINGGTYIYEGTTVLATVSKGTVLKNATFICTKATSSVLHADGYRYNNLSVENCVFYSPSGASVISKGSGNSNAFASATSTSKFNFNSCYFVNVALTEKLTVNYKVSDVATDFHVYMTYASPIVSTAEDLALAYAGADLTGLTVAYLSKNVNGVDYKLMGYYDEATTSIGTVVWGLDIADEKWLSGHLATHEDVLVDGVFIYAFRPFTVQAGSNTAESYLKTIAENAVQMSLTLKNKISANVLFAEALKDKVTSITVNGNLVSIDKFENGFGKYTLAFAPNATDMSIVIVVKVGEVELKTTWSVDMYAAAILASEAHAAVHHLTYAMIEYVRSMNAGFCAGVAAPAGYTVNELEAVKPENPETNTLLTELCFNLSETIEIQFKGNAPDGTDVNLILATTRSEHAEMMNGLVTFTDLYINEILGDMTIKVGNETYSYSLANYLHGIGGESPAVRALYNYAFHADAYVKTLPGYGT